MRRRLDTNPMSRTLAHEENIELLLGEGGRSVFATEELRCLAWQWHGPGIRADLDRDGFAAAVPFAQRKYGLPR